MAIQDNSGVAFYLLGGRARGRRREQLQYFLVRCFEAAILEDFEIDTLRIGGAQPVRNDAFVADDVVGRDVAAHETDYDRGGRV